MSKMTKEDEERILVRKARAWKFYYKIFWNARERYFKKYKRLPEEAL